MFLLLLTGIIAAILAIAYVCYRMGFYAPPRQSADPDAITYPEGDIYVPFYPDMKRWTLEARAMNPEQMEITSFDGLKLRGKYYEFAPRAPIELMFHGYRGDAERDLSGGVQRCFRLGHSALIVDQRCCGSSEGSTITMGIYESDKNLPENVIGILADCGYHSPREIVKTIIRGMGIPDWLGYPFARLGAKIYGHFDLEADTPVDALRNCSVPVIFFHGEDDAYVPCYMSKLCYDACASRKKLVTVPGAGHGLSFPVDQDGYIQAVKDFFEA